MTRITRCNSQDHKATSSQSRWPKEFKMLAISEETIIRTSASSPTCRARGEILVKVALLTSPQVARMTCRTPALLATIVPWHATVRSHSFLASAIASSRSTQLTARTLSLEVLPQELQQATAKSVRKAPQSTKEANLSPRRSRKKILWPLTTSQASFSPMKDARSLCPL